MRYPWQLLLFCALGLPSRLGVKAKLSNPSLTSHSPPSRHSRASRDHDTRKTRGGRLGQIYFPKVRHSTPRAEPRERLAMDFYPSLFSSRSRRQVINRHPPVEAFSLSSSNPSTSGSDGDVEEDEGTEGRGFGVGFLGGIRQVFSFQGKKRGQREEKLNEDCEKIGINVRSHEPRTPTKNKIQKSSGNSRKDQVEEDTGGTTREGEGDSVEPEESLGKGKLEVGCYHGDDGCRMMVFNLDNEAPLVQGMWDIEAHPLDFRLEYARQQVAVAMSINPRPQRILVLGLGVGAIPRTLRALYPQMIADVVEIEMDVIKSCISFFNLRDDPDMFNVFHQDAREFVKRTSAKGKYDIVYMDAYNAHGIPKVLRTRQFYEDMLAIFGRKKDSTKRKSNRTTYTISTSHSKVTDMKYFMGVQASLIDSKLVLPYSVVPEILKAESLSDVRKRGELAV
ncbi:hypothetical protein AAMO2058_000925100 [Amorphochlora amoebiformis]